MDGVEPARGVARLVEGHARCPPVGTGRWQWHGCIPTNYLARRASFPDHVQPADSKNPAAGLDRIRGGWSAHWGGPLAAHAGRCGYGGAARLDRECDLAWHPDCGRDRRLALQVESPLAHEGGTPGPGKPGWRSVGVCRTYDARGEHGAAG